MKKYTLTVADGKGGSREIKVRLDDETSRLLEEAGDPELTRAYIIEEYTSRNAERKETRRHVSLDKCMERGWDMADERADTESIAERRERDALLSAAVSELLPQQRELVKQVYYETFEYNGKEYYGYYIKGVVRGREVKIGIAPPNKDTDKGGYTVLDLVFG